VVGSGAAAVRPEMTCVPKAVLREIVARCM
jgi:hypothetical protein